MKYETLKKMMFKFSPETAHTLAEKALRLAVKTPFVSDMLVEKFCLIDTKLSQNLFGKTYLNPVGIGGGFDKNATMIEPLSAFGFGFLEYGTFTPKPQSGNKKPRLFRLASERSLQNAMGFNNQGSDKVKKRASRLYPFSLPLWANVGKNKTTPNENALDDYRTLITKFDDVCDVFVINISSPNTPNLRDLQEEKFVREMFCELAKVATKPLFLKIAPDMSAAQAVMLCTAAVESGAKGVICNNTSVDYTLSPNAKDFGGISGELITSKSRTLFNELSAELFGRCVLVSCGGVKDAEEAYLRIRMGANLVELFTGFVYEGPSVVRKINEGILELLVRDGFSSISEAVGALRK